MRETKILGSPYEKHIEQIFSRVLGIGRLLIPSDLGCYFQKMKIITDFSIFLLKIKRSRDKLFCNNDP